MKWWLITIGCAVALVLIARNELFFAFYQSGMWH